MIHVIVTVELHEGQREAFLAEFHKIVPQVLAEGGCIEYGPTIDVHSGIAVQSPLRENVVTIVEKWTSLEALERHLSAPHMVDYRPKVRDFISRTTLVVLEPV